MSEPEKEAGGQLVANARRSSAAAATAEPVSWARFLKWVSLLPVLAALIAAAKSWAVVESHTGDQVRHIEPAEVVHGGGVAYKNDVRAATDAIAKELRGLRRALRNGTCRRIPNDGLQCTFDVPAE